MKKLMPLLLASGLSLAAAPPLQMPQMPQAVPQGPWQVDYGDQQCLALRKFSLGTLSFVLALSPDIDGRTITVTFRTDQPLGGKAAHWVSGKVSLDQRVLDDQFLAGAGGDGSGLLIAGNRAKDDEPKLDLEHAKFLALESRPLTVSMPLTAMAKVVPVMKDCSTRLMEKWGMSRAEQASIAEWPGGSIIQAFSSDDYPQSAMMRNSQGLVTVHFRVAADGRASGCFVGLSSGDRDLDAATCIVINKRGRMRPAKDHAGRPVSAVVNERIRWILPD